MRSVRRAIAAELAQVRAVVETLSVEAVSDIRRAGSGAKEKLVSADREPRLKLRDRPNVKLCVDRAGCRARALLGSSTSSLSFGKGRPPAAEPTWVRTGLVRRMTTGPESHAALRDLS